MVVAALPIASVPDLSTVMVHSTSSSPTLKGNESRTAHMNVCTARVSVQDLGKFYHWHSECKLEQGHIFLDCLGFSSCNTHLGRTSGRKEMDCEETVSFESGSPPTTSCSWTSFLSNFHLKGKFKQVWYLPRGIFCAWKLNHIWSDLAMKHRMQHIVSKQWKYSLHQPNKNELHTYKQ